MTILTPRFGAIRRTGAYFLGPDRSANHIGKWKIQSGWRKPADRTLGCAAGRLNMSPGLRLVL